MYYFLKALFSNRDLHRDTCSHYTKANKYLDYTFYSLSNIQKILITCNLDIAMQKVSIVLHFIYMGKQQENVLESLCV